MSGSSPIIEKMARAGYESAAWKHKQPWETNPWAREAWIKCAQDMSAAVVPADTQPWEVFRDPAYYDLWAVRPTGETRWGHCFHLPSEDEANALAALLAKVEARS